MARKDCKKCNGTGQYKVDELPVIGSDGEYEIEFDVTVSCGCSDYEWN